ncbi:MAG: glycosyltransferase [Bacteroidales bacterium]|nr:glycosyltransferase [Bacteroidales bacterium]
MESSPLISIVVACFNVQDYVARCVDSILAQTYPNVEVILVDDGSTDHTSMICDQYVERYHNISVVHQNNQGQSSAKNVGVSMANGEYLTFVDSDDTISPTYIQFLYDMIIKGGADIAVSTFKLVYEPYVIETTAYDDLDIKVMSSYEAVEAMFYQELFDTTAPCKLYKKSLFDSIYFPVGISFDDLPTIYKVMLKALKIAYSDYPYYNYLVRNNSIEGSAFNERKYQSMLKIVSQLNNDVSLDPIRKAVNCRIFSFVFRIYMSMPDNDIRKKSLWEYIIHTRWEVLKNSRVRRKARYAALLSFGGTRLVSYVYNHIKTR